MTQTFVTILTAHLLGDFVFQCDWMVRRKRNVGVLLLHVAVVTLASWLLTGTNKWELLIGIGVSHLVMDAVKAYLMPDSFSSLLIDQVVHLAALVGLAWVFSDAVLAGFWMSALPADVWPWYFAALSLLSGIILAVRTGGILIEQATRGFLAEISDDKIDGLQRGGQYIGWLERSLVMLLVFMDQATGIGFVIAAKSILRFGEIKEPGQRKVAEYVIIGTFFSFGWALLIAELTRQAVHYWLGP